MTRRTARRRTSALPASRRPAPAQALRALLAVAALLFGGLLPPAAVAATPAATARATAHHADQAAHPHAKTRPTSPHLARATGDHPHHTTHPTPGAPPPHRYEPGLHAAAWTPQLRAASADRVRYAGRCLDRAPPLSHR